MTDEERSELLDLLETTSNDFIATIERIPPEKWMARAREGEWSPCDAAVHSLLAERGIAMTVKRSLSNPPDPDWHEKTADRTEFMRRVLPVAAKKVEAPERLRPEAPMERADLVAKFREARDGTMQLARDTPAEALDQHTSPHPMRERWGTLNAYQWLLYNAYHLVRHTSQIREILEQLG